MGDSSERRRNRNKLLQLSGEGGSGSVKVSYRSLEVATEKPYGKQPISGKFLQKNGTLEAVVAVVVVVRKRSQRNCGAEQGRQDYDNIHWGGVKAKETKTLPTKEPSEKELWRPCLHGRTDGRTDSLCILRRTLGAMPAPRGCGTAVLWSSPHETRYHHRHIASSVPGFLRDVGWNRHLSQGFARQESPLRDFGDSNKARSKSCGVRGTKRPRTAA